MNVMLSKKVLIGLVGIGMLTFVGSSAFAGPPKSKNGTTLAASKTLDICKDGASFTYSGEISVWNEGAQDTQGLTIVDCIQNKESGSVWTKAYCSPDDFNTTPNPSTVQAGTTQATATVYKYSFTTTDELLPGDIRNSVEVEITNHSGHLGHSFGPNPKATWAGGEVQDCEAGPCGCTLTQGYWMNHAWPAEGPDQTDPFYSTGLTWIQALTTPPAGNKFYNLSGQYIAAFLNQLNGACTPEGLFGPTGTFTQAKERFEGGFKPADCPLANSCGTENTWAGILDTYNNGTYPGGPAHCED